jgi:1,2-dihydroxy-3-keto-5-methylthiopentene dioxygenase
MNATLTSTLRVYDENDPSTPLVDTTNREEIAELLGAHNILFEQWEANAPLSADADQDAILAAYADDVARL